MAGDQAEMAGALLGGMSEMREGGAEPPLKIKLSAKSQTRLFHLPTQIIVIKKISLKRLQKLKKN